MWTADADTLSDDHGVLQLTGCSFRSHDVILFSVCILSFVDHFDAMFDHFDSLCLSVLFCSHSPIAPDLLGTDLIGAHTEQILCWV